MNKINLKALHAVPFVEYLTYEEHAFLASHTAEELEALCPMGDWADWLKWYDEATMHGYF